MAGELLWIIGASIFAASLGFVGIFSLWISKRSLDRVVHLLTAFAAGSLLGGAFIHLLPEALEAGPAAGALGATLAGFLLMVIFETYLHWHHCKDCGIHPFSYLMLFGDALHNFLDGVVLATSFMVGIPIGIVTTIAIMVHEFPQELGVFGVLVKGGFEKKKAITYTFLAQSTIIIGAIAGYILSGSIVGISVLLIPFAAGNFIYIASADLIPEMHRSEGADKLVCLSFFFLGLAVMWMLKSFVGEA
jgi:zinc and cadmium transporter